MRIIHTIIFLASIQLHEQCYKKMQLISTHIDVVIIYNYKYIIFQS